MIETTSYLRDPAGEMVPVTEADFVPPDADYIEGGIDLVIERVPVLDRSMWDLVDQLWAYISHMVATLATKDSATTYFPDQPIEFSITRVGGGRVRVASVAGDRTRESVTREEDLLSALRKAGLEFFAALSELVPGNASTYRASVARLSAVANHTSEA